MLIGHHCNQFGARWIVFRRTVGCILAVFTYLIHFLKFVLPWGRQLENHGLGVTETEPTSKTNQQNVKEEEREVEHIDR